MNKFGIFMALLSAIALSSLSTGCTTTSKLVVSADGTTNTVKTSTVDPVKISQIEKALEPVVAGATRRVLKNSPQHSDEIALYLRSVGTIFCDMEASGQFAPEYLIDAADKLVAPNLDDDYVIDIKNTVIAIYKISWGDRFTAELPAAEWSGQVCKLICGSIDQGLKDSGKIGTR